MQKTLNDNPADENFLSHGPATSGKPLVDRDRVAAWWLPAEAIADTDWPLLESLLIEPELVRSQRFHFDHDRRIYVVAHALCRGLLSYCLGAAPQSFRFSVEDHGKPELICAEGTPRYRVNISHTRGLAAVALTQDHDIGVDVEWLQRNAPTESLAKRMFADSEYRHVLATPEADRLDVFLGYWTLKEAYVKAIGKGLSQPLDAFAFDLECSRISFRDPGADTEEHWHFERCRPATEHLMALGVRHPDRQRLKVDTRKAPLDYLRRLASA